MAKIDISVLRKRLDKLEKTIRGVSSSKILKEIAEEARDLIYKRVKAGGGVSSLKAKQPKKVALAPLGSTASNPTEARRKYIARRKQTKLGPFGKPSKSNLTLTGQMLEAFRYIIRRSKITLFVPGTPRRDTKATNKQVAEFVSEKRPWLALTKQEQSILRRKLRVITNRLIKKI